MLTREEMVKLFELEKVHVTAAMFDPKKLAWMNGEYIKKIPAAEFRDMLVRSSASEGSSSGSLGEYAVSLRSDLRDASERIAWWDYLAAQIQVRTKFLTGLGDSIRCFVSDDFPFDEKVVEKRLRKPGVKALLLDLAERFEKVADWSAPALEAVVKELSQGNGMGPWVHPIRVAVSGRGEGIGLFEMLQLLGRETTLARLRKAAETMAAD